MELTPMIETGTENYEFSALPLKLCQRNLAENTGNAPNGVTHRLLSKQRQCFIDLLSKYKVELTGGIEPPISSLPKKRFTTKLRQQEMAGLVEVESTLDTFRVCCTTVMLQPYKMEEAGVIETQRVTVHLLSK